MSHKRLLLLPGIVLSWGCLVCFTPAQANSAPPPAAKLHPGLMQRLNESPTAVKAWVFFKSKGIKSPQQYAAAIEQVASTYNPRAIQRRLLRGDNARRGGALFDEHDLPVVQDYIDAVTATGARVHVISKWVNAVSVYADRAQLDKIAQLDCVKKLQPVARAARIIPPHPKDPQDQPPPSPPTSTGQGRLDYGRSQEQLAQINLIALHEAGHTAAGVIIGILDTGFERSHVAFNNAANPVHIVAEYDFVDGDPYTYKQPDDPSSQHEHGTMILGCLGAYMPGDLVGGAYDASFILCKTEDTTDEYPAEEDNYVAGLEFIEANGADMSTASLGYIDWYTQSDLDGLTAVTTIAVNISTGNGVHHCNAAGNEYHDSDPQTSSIIAPADGFDVITCGAVTRSGGIVSFSSDGPTADGRVKPEVLALGSGTDTVDPFSSTGYTTASGTSLSTPLVASAVACLIQARPYWTVDRMRRHLFETADYYVANETYDPLYVLGYGIIDAYSAYDICSDAGVVTLDRAKYACQSTATIMVNDCGLNTNDAVIETVSVTIESDSESGGESVLLTEMAPDAAEFAGSITLSETDAPEVLLIGEGDTITAIYIDADDGEGGINVTVTDTSVVDCSAPVISNVGLADLLPRSAVVTFDTDEPTTATVHYGQTCDGLTETAWGSSYATSPTVALTGLIDNTTYFYTVEAEDEAGNLTADDNGGLCHTFTTPDVPDYFTELSGAGNDLDGFSLRFAPDGSADFYSGCVEPIDSLPTDPSGGTQLSLGDDDYEMVALGDGALASLYGTSYSTFYPASNGYVTFTAGDTAYTESLGDHFDLPRISALFDDLNPNSGGSVSWKQLDNRAVVTWENIPEYSATGSNTFQIEMFFNGDIAISYLSISAGDGLVGLSAGGGTPAGFYESDLSGLGDCGPKPPVAYNVAESTGVNAPIIITLQATDDSLPDPPAGLEYIITELPAHGVLTDPQAATITTVPHALVGGGNQVGYAPHPCHRTEDGFMFKANDGGVEPEGGDSNNATVSISIIVEASSPRMLLSFPLDNDPGWTTQSLWAFGAPTGEGSHDGDPDCGYTGPNVYGYNLSGDYEDNLPVAHLTTTALDCSHQFDTELRFRRWLAIERYDRASVEVSADGVGWIPVWGNPTGSNISESSWSLQQFEIASVADGEDTVYIRWGMGPTDALVHYPGWNIDDIEIWGVSVPVGDFNGDSVLGLEDYAIFQACLAGPGLEAPSGYDCADLDHDGDVDLADFAIFQQQ
ncbi:MAG: S8 family serine peptidase [Phycisphaerae bacterium]|nr:S8 family serine peptidase [Phycisphaerae bacterium]